MSEAPDYIAISIDSDGTASVATAAFGSCHIYAHDRIIAAKDAEIERLRYVLGKVRSAIDTGRHEPLMIWRDQVDIALDDPANALTDPAAQEGQTR